MKQKETTYLQQLTQNLVICMKEAPMERTLWGGNRVETQLVT
jgi:hypothetical protein